MFFHTHKILALLTVSLLTHPIWGAKIQVHNKNYIIKQAESFNTDGVYERFKTEIKKKFDIDDEQVALSAQREALRYLTLCAMYPEKKIGMFNEVIDEFWHTFILFSREYFAFCKKLGRPYIHHAPNVDKEKEISHHSFHSFAQLYKETFEEDLPAIWLEGKTGENCSDCNNFCAECFTYACHG